MPGLDYRSGAVHPSVGAFRPVRSPRITDHVCTDCGQPLHQLLVDAHLTRHDGCDPQEPR